MHTTDPRTPPHGDFLFLERDGHDHAVGDVWAEPVRYEGKPGVLLSNQPNETEERSLFVPERSIGKFRVSLVKHRPQYLAAFDNACGSLKAHQALRS